MNISKNNEVKKNTFVWGGGRGLSDKIHLSPPKFLPKYATANGEHSTSEKSGGVGRNPVPPKCLWLAWSAENLAKNNSYRMHEIRLLLNCKNCRGKTSQRYTCTFTPFSSDLDDLCQSVTCIS